MSLNNPFIVIPFMKITLCPMFMLICKWILLNISPTIKVLYLEYVIPWAYFRYLWYGATKVKKVLRKIIHLVDTEIKREMLFFDSLTLSCIMHNKVNIVCIGISTTPPPQPSKKPPSWMHEKVNHSVHCGINHPPPHLKNST